MKILHKSLLSLILLVPCMTSYSQNLAKLGTAPEITVGSFPNGLKYYLVTNKAAYGYADYALVQKGVHDESKAREDLESLAHFGGQKPYQFMSSRGVGYKKNGYVLQGEDFTMYRFEDVPTSDVASSDTTLMMLFDFCALCPTEQAIIISGDIDAAAVKGKMSIFSLMISKRQAAPASPEYIWDPQLEPKVVTTVNHYDNITSVKASFAMPRTSAGNLNTVQSLVSAMMFSELDVIIRNRLTNSFKAADIPVAGIELSRKKCSDGYGDEAYSIEVLVSRENVFTATELLAGVIANMETVGVSEPELQDVRDENLALLNKNAQNVVITNSEYLDKCAAAYVYGTDLAPYSAGRDFFSKKRLPIAQDAEIFNSFIKAMFDKSENLTLTIETPDIPVSSEEVIEAYQSAWKRPQDRMLYRPHYKDTLSLHQGLGKEKLKLESSEPVTGSAMWTFANGMKVVYKKAATAGQFSYAFMFRGGYASVPDLKPGEGAFVSDLLSLYDVSGKSCSDFNSMLDANGITMDRHVSISDMRFSGTAPNTKLNLLFSSVLSFMKDRTFNYEQFEYYKKCEALRLEYSQMSKVGLCSAVDAVLRPDFAYTQYKYEDNLSSSLPSNVEKYLTKQFNKCDDGIIVLVGDLDEYLVKKLLSRYLGSFRTNKALAPRPDADYNLMPGWSSCSRQAAHPSDVSINIAVSSFIPVTAERYYAFRIAQMIMQKYLSQNLSEHGVWTEVTDECEFFPKERMSVMIYCHPSEASGLPASIRPADPQDAIAKVREALDAAFSNKVKDSDLKIYKALLQKQMQYESESPDNIINAVLTRYSDGKDISSKYAEAINALSAATVEDVLAGLGNGSKVEYIIHK